MTKKKLLVILLTTVVLLALIDIIVGFFLILFLPIRYWLVISIPVAIVNAFLNLLPIFILRYNVPKLSVAYVRAKKLNNQENKK